MINKATTRSIRILACWTVLAALCAVVNAQTPAPTYWKHSQFFIPYQANQRGKLRDPISKVELLVSRTGNNDWTTLQEAEPNVQGFSYHAPGDGEYWFALRHLDRHGKPWPNDEVRPQMHMVIDTEQPKLTLEAMLDANGEAVIRYESQDANLQPQSLLLEIRPAGKNWTPLRSSEPDIAQSNRLVGRARWRPSPGIDSVEVRAAIADRAGQRAEASTTLAVQGPQPQFNGPSLGSPAVGNTNLPIDPDDNPAIVTNPFVSAPESLEARLPSHDWPATNRLPVNRQPLTPRQSPPPTNPYSVASQTREERVPAQLIADGQGRSVTRTDSGPQSLQITPLDTLSAPPLMNGSLQPSRQSSIAESDDLWSAPAASAAQAERVVNSQTFDIEYDLQSVGPWGVAKVELWGTADSGQSWRSFGIDPDNRSPVRVTVPGAGTFGFRILVDGANTAGSTPPRPGDEPELSVSVDLQPPTTELLSAQLGRGNLSDHLLVRWSATDTNLEARPIALFYSSYPNGPWSTIASGLENTGSYTWRVERHVPGRFYLRLEARDVAGNVATYQTSSPIALARPQPTGRLKGVRPITSDK